MDQRAPLLVRQCDQDIQWNSESTFGYCVYLGSNLVTWSSKKQHVVSRSNTEAEYRSLAAVSAEISWLKSLLQELQVPQSPIQTVFCDNLGAVLLVANHVLHSLTKHFELDLYFVCDKVQEKQLIVQHIPSFEQTADVLTKPIPPF